MFAKNTNTAAARGPLNKHKHTKGRGSEAVALKCLPQSRERGHERKRCGRTRDNVPGIGGMRKKCISRVMAVEATPA